MPGIDTTRRRLLELTGLATLSQAASAAARAEGAPMSVAPGFAQKTPMHCAMVALNVRDLERSTSFYTQVLGLDVTERGEGRVSLGAGGVPLLQLTHAPFSKPDDPRAAGLFHTAFLQPSRKDLARWLVHAASNGVRFTGFADHNVSEAVYLDDPEGNGVEVYADRRESEWTWSAGQVTMGTDQLNIDGLLSLVNPRQDDYAKAPAGLRIGHMHVRVGDVAQALPFYNALVGLDVTRQLNGAGFLSSGHYHHHLGINMWRSAGAQKREPGRAGLDWFSFSAAREPYEQLGERLAKANTPHDTQEGRLLLTDPWGTRLTVIRA